MDGGADIVGGGDAVDGDKAGASIDGDLGDDAAVGVGAEGAALAGLVVMVKGGGAVPGEAG